MSTLTLIRLVAARPSIVFDSLTRPEALAAWFGPDEGPVLAAQTDPRIGGRYRVRFRTLDGAEHECAGEYLDIVEPERLVMSWQWSEGGGDPGESRLEFSLRPVETGTELTLIHAELRDEESRIGHEGGWSGALAKLARYLQTPSKRSTVPRPT